VNALSATLDVEIRRGGRVWQQPYAKGKPLQPLREVGKTNKTGTKITFRADPEIFSVTAYNFDALSQRMRELAFLNPGVTIEVVDERDETGEKKHVFRYEGGISSFVEHLNKNREKLHENVIFFTDVKDPSGDPRPTPRTSASTSPSSGTTATRNRSSASRTRSRTRTAGPTSRGCGRR
jgi:Type IIA topoisomerase (DNA gyrase/topo II, topoisomerase IV), B subunit